MPGRTIDTLEGVITELRKLSSRLIRPKDVYFASMADTVQRLQDLESAAVERMRAGDDLEAIMSSYDATCPPTPQCMEREAVAFKRRERAEECLWDAVACIEEKQRESKP